MAVNWYALRSKSRKEEVVWKQVMDEGFESYFPRLRVQPVNPRSRKLQAYFPGYMFVRIDLELSGHSKFQWLPHSLGLVSFGGEPAVVPDHLISAIRKRLDEINVAGGELFHGLESGDKVWINEGPLRGYDAIFDIRLPGSERVRVLLEILGSQRRVPVELDASQIKKRNKK